MVKLVDLVKSVHPLIAKTSNKVFFKSCTVQLDRTRNYFSYVSAYLDCTASLDKRALNDIAWINLSIYSSRLYNYAPNKYLTVLMLTLVQPTVIKFATTTQVLVLSL